MAVRSGKAGSSPCSFSRPYELSENCICVSGPIFCLNLTWIILAAVTKISASSKTVVEVSEGSSNGQMFGVSCTILIVVLDSANCARSNTVDGCFQVGRRKI